MKNVFTRVITAFLAAALLTVPAFAEEITTLPDPTVGTVTAGTSSVDAEGNISIPSLVVTVPGYAEFIANPYELETWIGSTHDKGSVICPDILITNGGSSKIAVDIRAYGYPQGDTVLSETGAITAKNKEKQMALYIVGGTKKVARDGTVTYSYPGFNAAKCAVVTAEPVRELIDPEDESLGYKPDPIKPVRVLTVNAKDQGAFKVGGKVNTNTAEPWYLNDYVDLKLILNISPLSN